MSERNVQMSACAVARGSRYIYAGGDEGEYCVVVWNFQSPEERNAFRKSPIKSNIDNYITRNNVPWKGSKYAYKFQVPGLPEALFRYTQNADGGALDLKIATLKDNFFPIIPEFYSLMHVCAGAPFPILLQKLLEDGDLYSVDAYNKTPLTSAIEASNNDCISVITEFFRDCPEKFEVTFFDIQKVLEMDNKAGPDIYRMAFFDFGIQMGDYPKGNLPSPIVIATAANSVMKKNDFKR